MFLFVCDASEQMLCYVPGVKVLGFLGATTGVEDVARSMEWSSRMPQRAVEDLQFRESAIWYDVMVLCVKPEK
jgi:hypothetical protein